jgi:hypothetical protein
MDTIERGIWEWKEAQRHGGFIDNFNIYTYTHTPQNIYIGHVNVFDKYLHWPHVIENIYIDGNNISLSVKSSNMDVKMIYTYMGFTCCTYNYWHLHA